MNTVWKIFLSMSASGGLLILALLLGKKFFKDKISRQWQYYIWLIVIFRLLLPFGPENNLMGKTYQRVDRAMTGDAAFPRQEFFLPVLESVPVPAVGPGQENGEADSPAKEPAAVHPFLDIVSLLINHVWLVWLAAALGLLIRKVTIYQGFIRYVSAGLVPVSDIRVLDWLSAASKLAGIKKPIEICTNPLISSPLLIGFFHPCIVLPNVNVSEKDFRYIVLHELTHYRRRDMLYKWLVQLTVCLHWFNPLVHFMEHEIIKACEFSCDEAVLAKTGYDKAGDYGKTLLDAMAAVGKYREKSGAVSLSENKRLLKERLVAIMKLEKKSKSVKILTAVLTVCTVLGAVFMGVYTMGNTAGTAYAATPSGVSADMSERTSLPLEIDSAAVNVLAAEEGKIFSEVEKFYEAGSLPLFQIAFSSLDEEEQGKWLDKIYADRQIAFWGCAVGLLDEDSDFISRFAEKIYEDGNISFFSVLAMHMSEEALESWLDKSLEDGKMSFQSVLYNAMDREDEFDKIKEEKEKAYAEKCREVGVTIDGKNYYYQGQLVHIFLDIVDSNKSFYTLNVNPAGTVNIKIVREAGQITGVSYMTDEEVTELFGDEMN